MQLNHSDKVLDFDGKPIPQWDTDELGRPKRDSEGGLINKGDLTMKAAAMMALNGQDPNETIGAELKAKLFALTLKFYKGKKIKLTSEERVLLKERAGKTLSALAFGRLCEWVEGEPPALPTDEDDTDDEDKDPELPRPVRRIRDNPQA